MVRIRNRLLEDFLLIVITVVISYGLFGARQTNAGAAPGTSVFDQILARKALRFGIPVAGLPVAPRDQQGKIVGWVPDLGEEMAKSLGVKLDIVDTAAPSRIPFLVAGKIDVSIGTVTLERAKAVSFSNIWAVDGTAAVVLKSSGITSYDQVKGKKIAAVTGATGDLVASKRFPGNQISRFDQASTALQAVVSGQADIIFEDNTFLSLAVAANPNLLKLPPVTREPSAFMVPLGDQKWINWLNYFLNDYYDSGVSTCGCGFQVAKKWLKTDPIRPLNFTY